MAELTKWHDLRCECGSALFIQSLHYRKHSGQGGTSLDEAGVVCLQCFRPANIQKMWAAIRIATHSERLKSLLIEIGEDDAEGPPEKPASS